MVHANVYTVRGISSYRMDIPKFIVWKTVMPRIWLVLESPWSQCQSSSQSVICSLVDMSGLTCNIWRYATSSSQSSSSSSSPPSLWASYEVYCSLPLFFHSICFGSRELEALADLTVTRMYEILRNTYRIPCILCDKKYRKLLKIRETTATDRVTGSFKTLDRDRTRAGQRVN